MTDNKVRRALRNMAWERAKGELRSMLHTFYSSEDPQDTKEQFDGLSSAIEDFIKTVEFNGFHE